MATLIESYDINGLEFQVWEEISELADHLPVATLTIPGDQWNIVGGGAIVEWEGAGSLLTAMYPVSDLTWQVEAKDHVLPSPSRVRAYCTAARIPSSQIAYVTATGPVGDKSSAEAFLPPGFEIIGGGARVNWEDQGSLLYASRPGDGQSWIARAKAHGVSSPASVTAFALGLHRQVLADHNVRIMRVKETSTTDSRPTVTCGTGMQDAVMVSGGAATEWGGYGSLLTGS